SVFVCRLFFFFQAEDGIRDFHVTGVQTCALPICSSAEGEEGSSAAGTGSAGSSSEVAEAYSSDFEGAWQGASEGRSPSLACASRSEERRVGKGCRGER